MISRQYSQVIIVVFCKEIWEKKKHSLTDVKKQMFYWYASDRREYTVQFLERGNYKKF